MAENLTFTAFLKDEYSKNFAHLANLTDEQIKGIEKNLNTLSTSGNKAAHSIDEINKRIDVLSKAKKLTVDTSAIKYANDEIKSLEKEKAKLDGGEHEGGMFGMGGQGFAVMAAGAAAFYELSSKAKEFAQESIEKVHELHLAEAQLKNTMQSMGKYSAEGFERAVQGAAELSHGVNFSQAQIVSLESQLRLVGNIGEKEMQRLTKASADMATKFNMGLDEAGNAIAKAVNDPEMMRRLAMQLKIDPHTVDQIEKIAKAGGEAKARLELLNIVEQKVGGSAEAAFNSDPLARYHKNVEELKVALGDRLTPQLKIASGFMSSFVYTVKQWVEVPVSEKLNQEAFELRMLQDKLNTANIGESDRKEILDELNEKYGITIKNIKDEKDALKDLNEQIDANIEKLENQAVVAIMTSNKDSLLNKLNTIIAGAAQTRYFAYQKAEDILGKDAVSKIRKNASLTEAQKMDQLQQQILANSPSTIKQSPSYNSFLSYKKLSDEANGLQGAVTEINKNIKEAKKEFGLDVADDGTGKGKGKSDNTNLSGVGAGTNDSITGNSRITNLTITIDALVKGGVNVYSSTVKEGADKAADHVKAALLTAVNDANLIANQ